MTRPPLQPRVFTALLDPALLAAAPVYSELSSHAERLYTLGRSLLASPAWDDLENVVLVVRAEAPARIALIGEFTEEQAARAAALAGQVESTLRRFRYVGWAEAEEASQELAERLLAHFGRAAVEELTFTAIPRGGLIVLGMLAYVLGLRRDQILPPVGGSEATSARPSGGGRTVTVVVDDCALTGLRLRRCLAGRKGEVVFAHLYSPPDLRAAVEAEEERVVACLAARDVADLGPAVHGERYPDWRERWSARSDPGVYWVGLPEHICFAWNEPDVTIWNEVAGREEAAWRVAPPEACLKNRVRSAAHDRFWRQPEGKGEIRPGPDVVWAPLGEDLVVANCRTGEAVAFGEAARSMWEELLRLGEPEPAAESLATMYGVEPAQIRDDLERLLAEAMDKGLLVRSRP